MVKKYFNMVVVIIILCIPIIVSANVMHLVSGTITYEGGSSPDSPALQAFITSRPDEILTQDSSGCGYSEGYYWIQCGNFSTAWDAGDTLRIDVSDYLGFSAHGEVTLTYAAADPMNLVIEIITFDITVDTDPEGLEYVVDDTVYSAMHTFTWLENSQHQLSVLAPQYQDPDIRYDFLSWSNGQTQEHTIMANMDQSITAHFMTKYRLTTNSDPPSAGSIQLTPAGEYYAPGAVVTMKAEPDTNNGYIFSEWSGHKTGSTNPDTLHMGNGSKSVTAHFELRSHVLVINAVPSFGGVVIIEPEKSQYTFGEMVKLEAVPDTDFVFYRWTGDTTGNASTIFVEMNQNKTINANFHRKGILPIQLARCYPPDGSVYIPNNTDIQMTIEADPYGEDLDLNSLQVSVNDTLIIENGAVISGKEVEIVKQAYRIKIRYNPLFRFSDFKEVAVHVECLDLMSNVLDSTYSFSTNSFDVIITKCQYVNEEGGVVEDDILKVQAVIPEGVLEDTTQICIGYLPGSMVLPDTVERISLIYYFGPDGVQFSDSTEIDIFYTQNDLDMAGVEYPFQLPVYYFSTREGSWSRMEISGYDQNYLYLKVKEFCYLIFGKSTSTGIADHNLTRSQIPQKAELAQNFPNPFNSSTIIQYTIPSDKHVVIDIINVVGQKVRRLQNNKQSAGSYTVCWDSKDVKGRPVHSGAYIVVMKYGSTVLKRKILLIR